MRKALFFGFIMLLLPKVASSTELRHGVSFDLPDGLVELNPCDLPEPSSKIIPIAIFSSAENSKIKLYLLKHDWLPNNDELLDSLLKSNEKKYEVIREGEASYKEDMLFMSAEGSLNKKPNIGTFLLGQQDGYRLMIETEYYGVEQKEELDAILKSLELTDEFPSVTSTNQNLLQWTTSSSEWAPDCREEKSQPLQFFAKPVIYPVKALIKGKEGEIEVEYVVDNDGFITDIVYKGENATYFGREVERHMKSARYQIKLEKGVPVRQRNVKRALKFYIEDSSKR